MDSSTFTEEAEERTVERASRGSEEQQRGPQDQNKRHLRRQQRRLSRQGSSGQAIHKDVVAGGPPDSHGAETGGQPAAQAAKPQWARDILAALQEVKDAAVAVGAVTKEHWQQAHAKNVVNKKVHWADAVVHCYAVEEPGGPSVGSEAAAEEAPAGSLDDGLPPQQQVADAGPIPPTANGRRRRKRRPRRQRAFRAQGRAFAPFVPGSQQHRTPEDAWGCRPRQKLTQEQKWWKKRD